MNDYTYHSSDFAISNMCMFTMPCTHTVKINDKSETWSAEKIYNYLKKNNLKMDSHIADQIVSTESKQWHAQYILKWQ